MKKPIIAIGAPMMITIERSLYLSDNQPARMEMIQATAFDDESQLS